MAGESLIGYGFAPGVAYGSGFTERSNIFGGWTDGTTTAEADFNSPLKAGTLSKLRVYITASGGSAIATITSRINAVNGNQSIVQTIGATGEFEDGTHSDSITDGQLIDIQGVGSGSNTTVGIGTMQYVGTVAVTSAYGTGQGTFSDSAVTGNTFLRGQGCTSITTALIATEADAQIKIRSPGTLSNMRAAVSTNAGGNPTTTLVSRVNGVSGASTVSFTGGTTGAQTDATHSDSIVSGDLFCYLASSGGTSRTITYRQCSMIFVASTTTFDTSCGSGATGSNNSAVANSFNTIFGRMAISTQATEANAQARFRFATTASNLRAYIVSVSAATSAIVTLRQNGADGTSTVTTTAATTGWFEDVTHADSIASGDLVAFAHKSSNSNYSLGDVGLTFGNSVVTVNATAVTATGTPGTVTTEIDVGLTGATATGTAGTVSAGGGAGAVAATATGATGDTIVEIDIPIVGATATGSAKDVGAAAGSTVLISGVGATGAAGDLTLEIDDDAAITSATATASAHAVVSVVSVSVTGVVAIGAPGTVEGHASPHADFPVVSIMRNAAVPATGAMANTVIAVIGRLQPSGPQPMSVAAIIVGAYATAAVRNVTPFRNVILPLAGVIAQSSAKDCAVTVT